MKNGKVRIRWAMDPYTEKTDNWRQCREILHIIEKKSDCEIIPTYSVGHRVSQWVGKFTDAGSKGLKATTESLMLDRLAELELPHLCGPEVLEAEGYSPGAEVASFLNTAEKDGTDLIVVNTYSRNRMEKFFMGSFTETLLLKSKIPVLIVPPHSKSLEKLEKMFYPTDLSEESFEIFKSFLGSPVNFSSSVSLYHRVFEASDILAQSANFGLGGGWMTIEPFIGEEVLAQGKLADQWKAYAVRKGFSCDVKVEHNPDYLPEVIIQRALEQNSDIIALPTTAGKLDAVLLGSTARQVARRSEIPVMVWRGD